MSTVLLDKIKKTLQAKFDIDCFISIEDLEHSPSSTLYQMLIPYIKESYEHQYRFVFFNFIHCLHKWH